jgi:hypothetical protein
MNELPTQQVLICDPSWFPPLEINARSAIIPTPLLFRVAGIATLLPAIPLWFTKDHKTWGKQAA